MKPLSQEAYNTFGGIVIAGLLTWGAATAVYGVQTKEDPLKQAQAIWGDNAQIAQVNRGNGWFYEVGCYIPTSTPLPDFVIAGMGKSWKEAFESVDMSRNGPSKYLVLENGAKVPMPTGQLRTIQCNAGIGMKP